MKTQNYGLPKLLVLVVGVGILLWAVPAQATLKDIKTYKEAFPDAAPKCVDCHADAMPKKDDGQHEMSDYGKAVLETAKKDAEAAGGEAAVTVDTYKKVGAIENFKK